MNIHYIFCNFIQYNKQFWEVLSFPTLHENINIWQHTSRRRLHLQLEEVKRRVFPALPLPWSLRWIKGRRLWQGTGGRGQGAGLPCNHPDRHRRWRADCSCLGNLSHHAMLVCMGVTRSAWRLHSCISVHSSGCHCALSFWGLRRSGVGTKPQLGHEGALAGMHI